MKALLAAPEGFWDFLTKDEMVKMCFSPTGIGQLMEGLAVKKVIDVTSGGDSCHTTLRKVFPLSLTYPPELTQCSCAQADALKFVAHFKKSDCPHRLEKAAKLINDKNMKLANALLSFPHGRAVLASAIQQNESETLHKTKVATCLDNLSKLVAEFPNASSTSMFDSVGKELAFILASLDMEAGAQLMGILKELAPYFDNLLKAVHKYFKDTLGPCLVILFNTDMDFEASVADVDVLVMREVCKALPMFDDANQKSGGRLLPHAYQNFRTFAPDAEGILVSGSKCADAISGEYFNRRIAGALAATAANLHADKFRGAVGPLVNWHDFIVKFRGCSTIAHAIDFMMKDVKPAIAEVVPTIERIMVIKDVKDMCEDDLLKLQALVPNTVDANIDIVDSFAVEVGDPTLRSQLGMIRHALGVTRALINVKSWHSSSIDIDLTDANAPIVSKLRQAVRGARLQASTLAGVFGNDGDSSDTTHIVHDFDKKEYVEVFGTFLTEANKYLDVVQSAWQLEISSLSDEIMKLIPAWTPSTLMNADTMQLLTENAHFASLGTLSSKLYSILSAHTNMSGRFELLI